MKERPRVVILGGGIGGIKAAQQLANQPVDVLIIDHNNYQVFQPLLYQVATSMLSTDEVVYPIRGFFKKAPFNSIQQGCFTNAIFCVN